MTTLTDEKLRELASLAAGATPGPWVRITEGNASVEQLAHKLLHDLSVPLRDGVPANTDATYVRNADGSKHIAFIGNGPRQTDNGDFVAAASPTTVAALVSELLELRDRSRKLRESAAFLLSCVLSGESLSDAEFTSIRASLSPAATTSPASTEGAQP